MSYGPTIRNRAFSLRSAPAPCSQPLRRRPCALAQANVARELPTLAPMIETISPAVVNIAVTSNSTGGPQTPQDELLRRFFDFEGPPRAANARSKGRARASSSTRPTATS